MQHGGEGHRQRRGTGSPSPQRTEGRSTGVSRVASMASMSEWDPDTDDPKVYHVRKSRIIKLVNYQHLLGVYLPYVVLGGVALLVAQLSREAWMHHDSLVRTYDGYKQAWAKAPPTSMILFDMSWKMTAVMVVGLWYLIRTRRPVYLVDFSVFEAPPSWRVDHEQLIEIMRRQQCFSEESIDFMARILSKSGTGPETAWPPGITRCLEREGVAADRSVEAARSEAATVIFGVVEDVLRKTGVKAKEVDHLIINCSLFSPTPSLCSMVIHHFGLRRDVRSYNLSGMGCSAGVISVDLAKELLAANPNSVALVVSTENLTQNLYHGNERSMLLQNTLFRCGGAAMVLSNRWQDAMRAKFKLLYTVRTQGEGQEAYEAVYECEDDKANHGVRLSKQIVNVAGKCMQDNFTSLGPQVLPISEQIPAVKSYVLKYLCKLLVRALERRGLSDLAKQVPRPKTYMPDFKRGIDHFCIHAGGRGVIDGIEKSLQLTAKQTEPSRMTLYKYGNTSSSSIWYEMDYIRKNANLRSGQRILQVAFGSGFKTNSAVWLSMRPSE
jgi:predicted naringenin-chalcone synthase